MCLQRVQKLCFHKCLSGTARSLYYRQVMKWFEAQGLKATRKVQQKKNVEGRLGGISAESQH